MQVKDICCRCPRTCFEEFFLGWQIFLGNYDSTSTVKEELYSGMVAKKVRFHVKTSHGLACLKLQLFGVKQSLGTFCLFDYLTLFECTNRNIYST